jgi:hypothetical protein
MAEFTWEQIGCNCGYGDNPPQGCPQNKMEHNDKCYIWVKKYPEDQEIIDARKRVADRHALQFAREQLARQLGVSPETINIRIDGWPAEKP